MSFCGKLDRQQTGEQLLISDFNRPFRLCGPHRLTSICQLACMRNRKEMQ